MRSLTDWVESGHAITFIIAVVVIEIVALGLWRKRSALSVIAGLIPGLCLMLALRASLLGQGAEWVGIWLTAALPAHALDLKLRLKAGEVSKDFPQL